MTLFLVIWAACVIAFTAGYVMRGLMEGMEMKEKNGRDG